MSEYTVKMEEHVKMCEKIIGLENRLNALERKSEEELEEMVLFRASFEQETKRRADFMKGVSTFLIVFFGVLIMIAFLAAIIGII